MMARRPLNEVDATTIDQVRVERPGMTARRLLHAILGGWVSRGPQAAGRVGHPSRPPRPQCPRPRPHVAGTSGASVAVPISLSRRGGRGAG